MAWRGRGQGAPRRTSIGRKRTGKLASGRQALVVGAVCLAVLMKMVSEETEVKGWKYYCDADSEVTHLRELPKSVRVYEINGPMFFGMTDRITDISVKGLRNT